MACRRWSFDLYHSHSIGRVIGFKVNKTAPYGGLLVELTDGGRCYNKNVRHYVKAKTTIKMICDKSAGEGVPTPESDKQGK